MQLSICMHTYIHTILRLPTSALEQYMYMCIEIYQYIHLFFHLLFCLKATNKHSRAGKIAAAVLAANPNHRVRETPLVSITFIYFYEYMNVHTYIHEDE